MVGYACRLVNVFEPAAQPCHCAQRNQVDSLPAVALLLAVQWILSRNFNELNRGEQAGLGIRAVGSAQACTGC